jgi:hypothetical protein
MKSKQVPLYTPKGSMCGNCEKANRDCSSLAFHTMPVIEKLPYQRIVRCTYYVLKLNAQKPTTSLK